MKKYQLNTPVAIFIFNRPDTTKKVFAKISKAKPPKLLIIADGARTNYPGDEEKVMATRAIIEGIDWPCEVLKNYSPENLGCKKRVSTGLDWVFENVEEAIILEDDCLPHDSFFRFCEELLIKFRNDQRVNMISGHNFQYGFKENENSYYFSQLCHLWGWACWSDRWKNDYDVEMKQWPKVRDSALIDHLFDSKLLIKHFIEKFEFTYNNKIDTWDYQWVLGARINRRISVVPNINLISNIGFRADATHTTGEEYPFSNSPVYEMKFPILHPKTIVSSNKLDERFAKLYLYPNLFQRILRKIKKYSAMKTKYILKI
jgi:hypothetical protein